jgi:vacuolar-type H+-ATPase subunit I/STV1
MAAGMVRMNAQLSLYDALVSVNIPADKARAVVAALEQEMTSVLATKSDIELVRQELHSVRDSLRQDFSSGLSSHRQEIMAEIESLRQELHAFRDLMKKDLLLLQHGMTIRLGVLMAVSMSLLFAGLKLT